MTLRWKRWTRRCPPLAWSVVPSRLKTRARGGSPARGEGITRPPAQRHVPQLGPGGVAAHGEGTPVRGEGEGGDGRGAASRRVKLTGDVHQVVDMGDGSLSVRV